MSPSQNRQTNLTLNQPLGRSHSKSHLLWFHSLLTRTTPPVPQPLSLPVLMSWLKENVLFSNVAVAFNSLVDKCGILLGCKHLVSGITLSPYIPVTELKMIKE